MGTILICYRHLGRGESLEGLEWEQMERLPLWQIAIRRLGMPVPEYAMKVVLPSTIVGLLVGAFVFWGASGLFTGVS